MRGFLSASSLGAPALLALAAACGGGGSPSGSPSPSTTAAPSPVTTVSPAPSPSAQTLTLGDPIPLPSDIALVQETGCWQCDGPTTGFMRVYRDASGLVRMDTLLSIEKLGLGPRLKTADGAAWLRVVTPAGVEGWASTVFLER